VLTPAQIALIDEFGKLYGEKQSWTPRERRMELLTETIRSWYQDLPAEQTAIAVGTDCEVQVGEKPVKKSWISIPAVCKALAAGKTLRSSAAA
jgi:hypothetical protein